MLCLIISLSCFVVQYIELELHEVEKHEFRCQYRWVWLFVMLLRTVLNHDTLLDFLTRLFFFFPNFFFLCVYLRNSFIIFFWWYFTLVSMPWTSCDTEPKRLIRHWVPCRIMSTVRGCVRATRLVSDEVPRVYFL